MSAAPEPDAGRPPEGLWVEVTETRSYRFEVDLDDLDFEVSERDMDPRTLTYDDLAGIACELVEVGHGENEAARAPLRQQVTVAREQVPALRDHLIKLDAEQRVCDVVDRYHDTGSIPDAADDACVTEQSATAIVNAWDEHPDPTPADLAHLVVRDLPPGPNEYTPDSSPHVVRHDPPVVPDAAPDPPPAPSASMAIGQFPTAPTAAHRPVTTTPTSASHRPSPAEVRAQLRLTAPHLDWRGAR